MSNQIQITGGAKVRNLEGVLTGTSGVVSSLGINVPDGIPQLDGSGKILVSQLPNSVMEYKGTWDASTNTPTLANGTGNAGDVYVCNVAGTVNFGAGPITFYVGDQVLYSGTIWQRASGSSGSVTSVAVTESGDALTITGSPITTSGTINIGFAGTGAQYVKGDGTLATFPSIISQAQNLVTEVYNKSGATLTKGTVVYINGGQGNLPSITKALATSDATSAQTYGVVQADITNMNNGYVVVAGRLQDIDTQAYTEGTQLYLSSTTAGAWTSTKQYAPAHLVYVGIVVRSHPTQGVVEVKIQNGYELDELHNVSAQTPSNNDGLFYNSSNSLWEAKSIPTALGYTPLSGGGTAGNIPYYTGTYTLGNENGFMYDSSTNRFGVNTTVPNATIGANASIDSGYSLLLKNADANYNGIGFGINTTYGNTFETQKLGTAAARNLTLLNQSGYISLTEGGNLGINILSPIASPSGIGSKGIDIYGDSQAASIGFHNIASGTGNTNGAYLYLTNTGTFTLRNLEGGIGASSLGDFSVVTNSTENFRVNSVDGTIWQSNIPNALLKTVSGVLTAAVAGTDYVAPSALSGYVPTSRTLTINGTTYDLSANRSWSVGTTTGSGSADSVAFWNSSSNLTYDSVFYYSSTNKRLGVNTTSPNATIGANAGIDSGYSLLLKNSETNYNGLGFGINSTYGNTIETVKVGTASARNLTLFNQTGYATLTEAGNFGFNILTPTASPSGVGSVGIDIFGGASAAGLGFHNTASGTGNTNGAYLYLLNNSNFTIRNLEGPIGVSSLGDFSVVTNSTENFRVNSSNGTIWQSNISDAMLKTVSGVLTAAVAGTDYVAPSALSSYVPTSRTITINGTTQDLSANRSWSVGTVTGSGTATRVAFWDGSSSLSSNTNLYWDNTNSRLGVGLTNPQRALEVYSATADTHLRLSGAAPSVSMGEAITGSIYQAKFGLATANNQFVTGSVAGDFVINNQTGATIWAYNSTEKMRLDTNGNLGIGGIANSSYRLHVFGTAPILAIESNTTGNVTLRFLQTGFNVSGISYINSDSSLRFTNNNGALIFNTGLVNGALTLASAGAATFSSTLDTAGNITSTVGATNTSLKLIRTGNTFECVVQDNQSRIRTFGASGNDKDLLFDTDNAGTTRLFIKGSTGNVGIGTTSPLQTATNRTVLTVNGTSSSIVNLAASDVLGAALYTSGSSYSQLYSVGTLDICNGSANPMTFTVNNTERMRITSGGNLFLGLTSGGGKFELAQSSAATWAIISRITPSSGQCYGILSTIQNQSPNNSSSYLFYGDDNVAARFIVYSNGGIANYQSNNANLSDKRTKKDIIPLESYWNKFKAIEIVKFKYKDQTHDDFNIGVIAQQVEEVAPEFIDVDGWGETPEDGVPLKSVYTADLHHATIKVLQEAMAKIETLEKELDELKAKIN